MQRFCHRCRGVYQGQMLCPRCGIELQAAPIEAGPGVILTQPEHRLPIDRVGLVSRLLGGLLLAQGLYYSFRRLGMAIALGLGESSDFWDDDLGLLILLCEQLLAVFLGGMFVGAGRPSAGRFGALIGACHAVLIGLVEWQFTRLPDDTLLYSTPIWLVAGGTIGGRVGLLIWQPPPELPQLTQDDPSSKVPEEPGEPLNIPGILSGIAIAFVCIFFTREVLGVISRIGGPFGMRPLEGMSFARFQLALLSLLGGGALASIRHRHGVRNGLIVGIGTLFAVLTAHFVDEAHPMVSFEFLLELLGLGSEGHRLQGAGLGLFCLIVLGIATVGGWVGTGLYPEQQRRRVASAFS